MKQSEISHLELLERVQGSYKDDQRLEHLSAEERLRGGKKKPVNVQVLSGI